MGSEAPPITSHPHLQLSTPYSFAVKYPVVSAHTFPFHYSFCFQDVEQKTKSLPSHSPATLPRGPAQASGCLQINCGVSWHQVHRITDLLSVLLFLIFHQIPFGDSKLIHVVPFLCPKYQAKAGIRNACLLGGICK